jgi:hypothetical protein
VNVVRRPRGDLVPELHIEFVDFARLDFLQGTVAQDGHDMTAQQLLVSFKRTLADLLPTLVARTADRHPMLDPLPERHLVGRNVFASIARVQKIAKGLLRASDFVPCTVLVKRRPLTRYRRRQDFSPR